MMMEEFEVNASEFLPLREVVYMTLRKAILTEKLRPGERLMENTIAQKLGVSRTPVREAIRIAEEQGKKSLRLDTLLSNTPAQRLYERLGFVCRGRQHLMAENTGWTDFLFYEY